MRLPAALRLIGHRRGRRTSLLLALTCLLAYPLQSAENISAYLDASGRVIFVNEGPGMRSTSAAPAASKAASSRRVVASTASIPANRSLETSAREPVSAEPTESGPSDFDPLIEQAATKHNVDPDLIRAIVQVESNFDPYAVSPKGARGLMQLIPATAQRFGVANPFDPQANLDGGIRYLKFLLGIYGGDLQLALAAYNAGENTVARSRGVPAIRETQNYIRKIGELYPLRMVSLSVPQVPPIMRFVDAAGVVHFSNTDLP
ncbi:MAG: lytic transglycosylase domain-containing protein [Acidobacteria bacterium]|nr:lytic transglycosylase domain-containing protein [Acidobacteriota bacterium]